MFSIFFVCFLILVGVLIDKFICLVLLSVAKLENFEQHHAELQKPERHGFTIEVGMVSHSENKVEVNDKHLRLDQTISNTKLDELHQRNGMEKQKYKHCSLLPGTPSFIISTVYDGEERVETQTVQHCYKDEISLLTSLKELNREYNIRIESEKSISHQDVALLMDVIAPKLAQVRPIISLLLSFFCFVFLH